MDGVGVDKVRAKHDALKHLRRLAADEQPAKLHVRDLIGYWGYRVRDSATTQEIDTDLANYGLQTRPQFGAVTLDDIVSVERTSHTLPPSTSGSDVVDGEGLEANERIGDEDQEDARLPEGGLTVGNLRSASAGVESVTPQATFEQAITKMLLLDYSQLAVMSGSRSPARAVTWKSIAKARNANASADFSAAIVEAREVSYQADLVDILPVLTTDEFVFVRNADRTIGGIVTAADVVLAYGEMASPFFLIGEIDQALRWILERSLPFDDVRALCDQDGDRGLSSFNQLTMGDYQRVLDNPAGWSRLGWPLDRKIFAERLREITETRNSIMHFNKDPLPADLVAMLKNFLALVREYASRE
jgi:CBS domain-containing protein